MKYMVLKTNKETWKNEPVIARRTLRSALYHAEATAHDYNTNSIIVLIDENKLIAKYTEDGRLLIF